MKTINKIKEIQKKCEIIAKKCEVVAQLDLAASYEKVNPIVLVEYEKKFKINLKELLKLLNESIPALDWKNANIDMQTVTDILNILNYEQQNPLHHTKDEQNKAIDFAIDAVKNQQEERWIPVKEKLPKISDAYLATFIENKKTYVERFYYSTFSGWLMPLEWQNEGYINEIIAWKQLPQPYEESGELY